MDIQKIEKELGISDLKEHLILLLKESREEADLQTEKIIQETLDRVKEESSVNNLNPTIIIGELICLQKIIYDKKPSDIHYYYRNYYFFSNSGLISLNNDDDLSLVEFIIKNYSILNLSHIGILSRIKNIKSDFINYFQSYFIEKKSILLFDKINQLNCLPDFIWNLDTIEKGVIEFYVKLLKDIGMVKIEHKYEIESLNDNADFELKKNQQKIAYLEQKYNDKVDSLNNDIKWLNRDIEMEKGTIELYKEYHKKYLEHNSTFIIPTYFGDNQPFLFNLYNFLLKNLLLKMTGWSYFYACMSIESLEIINLESKNNLKYIGRIFYNLIDFLDPKYKSDYFEFFKNKFYINEKPINDNFFKNHMRPIIDETLQTNLSEVDAFFNKQRDIYLKTK